MGVGGNEACLNMWITPVITIFFNHLWLESKKREKKKLSKNQRKFFLKQNVLGLDEFSLKDLVWLTLLPRWPITFKQFSENVMQNTYLLEQSLNIWNSMPSICFSFSIIRNIIYMVTNLLLWCNLQLKTSQNLSQNLKFRWSMKNSFWKWKTLTMVSKQPYFL